MKRCPACNRTYTDLALNFCLEDGTPLVPEAGAPLDPNATIRYSTPRDTNAPPTEVYRPDSPVLNQVAPVPQWSPLPPAQPAKKSNAIWWILGGVAVLGIIGIGLFIMIIAIASMSSNSNLAANNANSNTNVATRNTDSKRSDTSNGNRANTNTNSSASLPSSFSDGFSEQKWGTGTFQYGEIWYLNDEYHMRSKDKTYIVMYAPSNEYNTENATVKVTVRSIDGTSPNSGYGLIVHGEKTKEKKELEDYAFLIYSGDNPQYEVVMHKNGSQTTVVPWTKAATVRSGTSPNQLEVRTKDAELSFYINGQYLTKITDTANFKRGLAGFYTSDAAEVAFDNLEITR